MRKIVAIFILAPLAIVIVMFAVANRALITVSFDPFSSVQPAFALTLPLFVLIFVLVGLGVVIGGVATWLKQHKWRARARLAEAEAREMRARLDTQRLRAAMPAERSSTLSIPPAA